MGERSDKKKHKKQKHSHLPDNKEFDGLLGGAAEPVPTAYSDEPGPRGRKWTLSIALPGTLLDQPLSLEVAVCIAGQIARAAAAFQVDELVVYDDSPVATAAKSVANATITPGAALLARVLQFLDTPLHLRTTLYGDQAQLPQELQLAASLPAANPPHHARPSGTWMPYREGVVLKSEPGAGSYVDVGLDRMIWIEHELPQTTRVTVHLGDSGPETRFMTTYSETMIVGKAVSPSLPREQLGLYWGYSVRLALGLQRVFKDAAVNPSGRYDLTIGSSPAGAATDPLSLVLPHYKHALVVFGGGGGGGPGGGGSTGPSRALGGATTGGSGRLAALLDLEQLVPRVPDWENKQPQDVFNLYLNTTPHLGTLRLRAEDAVPIALSYLITPLLKYGKQ